MVVMGPKARDVLQPITGASLANADFPLGTMKQVELGMGLARAHRVSFVGELGWFIYAPAVLAAHIFEAIEGAGQPHGLKLCGLHVLDSCRIEKAFRHFGHDITDEDHVLEAGLGFAAKVDKEPSKYGDFIGREAVLRKKQVGLGRRMLQFRLADPEPLLFHNEALIRDGKFIGILTSGNYGHHLGAAIGMGYVPCAGETVGEVLGSAYEVEVAGRRYAAEASLAPMYDPKSERVRM
jgi:4-methylaminobutanoate oxidase (formaldehyde-forming)